MVVKDLKEQWDRRLCLSMMREHRSLAPPQLMDELYRRKLPHSRSEGATY